MLTSRFLQVVYHFDNAESLMALEALYQSTGLWDRYWQNAFKHRN